MLISALSANRAAAQGPVAANGIAVGGTVPDLFWSHPFNGKGDDQISMSRFKGKLIILDFWATWCSPCVAMIPKMDSLQKVFGEKIQFVSVAYQDGKTVLPFLSKLEQQKGRKFDIPNVVGDKYLVRLFPHQSLPHYVWIDGNGKVLAITDYDVLSASSIRLMFDKPVVGLALKDELAESSAGVPVKDSANNGIRFLSSLKGYQKGAASELRTEWVNDSAAFRLQALNVPVLNLFWYAYSSPVFEVKKYMKYDVADTSVFTTHTRGKACRDWLKLHGLTYEMVIPKERLTEFWSVIQADLVRMFPQYTLERGKELRDVLVLRRMGKGKDFASARKDYSMKGSVVGIEMKGGSFEVLVNNLNKFWLQHLDTPVIDETGYKDRVDIKIDGNMVSVPEINKSLAVYGLELSPAKRKVDIYIIHDTKTKAL